MFDNVVLKTSVNLAQVDKITRTAYKDGLVNVEEFYFHLKYPAKFFMSILKKEHGVSDNYIKKWERL